MCINVAISVAFFAFCDVLLTYLLTNNLCGFKASVAMKNMKLLPGILMFLLFFCSSFFLLYLNLLPIPDVFVGLLNPIPMFLATLIFIEKKKVSLSVDEKILVWLHVYTLGHLLFLILILVFSTFILNGSLLGYVSYFIGTLIIVISCQKLDFNKLLVFTLRKNLFKFLTFIIALLFFIISITFAEIHNLSSHRLLIFPFLVIVLVGLIYTIGKVHQNTLIIPEAYHDTKKLLMLLDIKAEEATDIAELKDMLSESITLMNLQLPHAYTTAALDADSPFEKLMQRTIDYLRKNRRSNVKIISNIRFTGDFQEINRIKSAYMLSQLLEYVLSTLTKRPIYVDISSSFDQLSLGVSCEYKFERNLGSIQKFFVHDEEVREEIADNMGLLKLKSLVSRHKGEALITRDKHFKEHVDYLTISLFFKKEGVSSE